MSLNIITDSPYGGKIYILSSPEDLPGLPVAGYKLLTAYQHAQFQQFPDALLELADSVKLTWLSEWLRVLARARKCQLEVGLTEYVEPQIFLRYILTDQWQPALSFQATDNLSEKNPSLLRELYQAIGAINLNGFGYAGGLLCPPDLHPDLGDLDQRGARPDFKGFMQFYQYCSGDMLLVNPDGQVGCYVHDDIDACQLIGSLETVLPAMFGAWIKNRDFLIDDLQSASGLKKQPDFEISVATNHTAQDLLAAGLPPVFTEYTQEQFLRAAKDGHHQVVAAYLTLGMPVDFRDPNNGGTALFRAVEGNHPELIRFLIESGADPEARDRDDDTPLHTAINWRHPEATQTLIELGADLTAVSRKHGTPLLCTVNSDKPELCDILLTAGALPDQPSGRDNQTPLMAAVLDGKLPFVERLITGGADINLHSLDQQRSLLSAAIIRGHLAIVKALIAAGAEVETTDAYGWTPWRLALYLGHKELAELLEEAGARTEHFPEMALLQAAQAGDVAGIQAALTAGTKIEALDPDGDTALALACYQGCTEAVKMLLDAGAATVSRIPDQYSPLFWAVNAQSVPCVRLLLAAGVPPIHGPGWSPLVKAAQKAHLELVQLLIDAGANLDSGDTKGYTALYWAAGRGNLSLLELLIQAGARLDAADNTGNTPLMIAIENNQSPVVEKIIAAGALLNHANHRGDTALHLACFNGRLDVLRLLLETGADPQIRNRQGILPLELAQIMNKKTCSEYFIKFLTEDAYLATLEELDLTDNETLPSAFYQKLATHHTNVALNEWVKKGANRVVTGLLNVGVSPNGKGVFDKTPLMVAAQAGNAELVQQLLRAGADVHLTSNTGDTALCDAVSNGNAGIIETLLAAGANPNHMNKWNLSPVHAAAEANQIHALEILFANGGLLQPIFGSETPLMRAVRFERIEAAKWLLDHEQEVQVDICNQDGESELNLAVRKRNLKLVLLLLNSRAQVDLPDKKGRTPLMYVAEAGDIELVCALLGFSADPTRRDKEGRTALDLAIGRPKITKLLSKRMDIPAPQAADFVVKVAPKPPFHRSAQKGDLALVQQLLDDGVEVDLRNAQGDTALMLAAERGHLEVVKLLLRAGADVRASNHLGANAWTLAAIFKHEAIVAVLKAAGAKTDVDHLTDYGRHLEKVSRILLDGSLVQMQSLLQNNEIDIDSWVVRGQSPLLIATNREDQAMAQLLLSSGADRELANQDLEAYLKSDTPSKIS